MHDCDGDGLTDLLANLRRGYGVVVYRNLGTREEPRFPPLHETQVLLRDRSLGRYFDLFDVDGDGLRELVGFDGQNSGERRATSPVKLAVYVKEGDDRRPRWRKEYAAMPDGRPLESPKDVWNAPRVDAADWDGDGLRDLLACRFHAGIFPYHNAGNDRFGEAVALIEPLDSHNAGVSVLDWDRDGIPDLLVGGDERRMIEPARPAHMVIFHGEDTLAPPGGRRPGR